MSCDSRNDSTMYLLLICHLEKIGLAVAGGNKTDNLESIAKRFYFFKKLVKGIYVFYCRLLHDHVPFDLEILTGRWHTKIFPSTERPDKILVICSTYLFTARVCLPFCTPTSLYVFILRRRVAHGEYMLRSSFFDASTFRRDA